MLFEGRWFDHPEWGIEIDDDVGGPFKAVDVHRETALVSLEVLDLDPSAVLPPHCFSVFKPSGTLVSCIKP